MKLKTWQGQLSKMKLRKQESFSELWDNFKWSNIHTNGIIQGVERQRIGRQKTQLKNKSIGPRRPMKPKQKKCEEDYIKAHHSQIAQSQW